MTLWINEKQNILNLIDEGRTLTQIGKLYGVSRQRMYQVFAQLQIQTLCRTRKSYLQGKSNKYYWLSKMLGKKKLDKHLRLDLLESIELPDYCPMLGIKLNYDGTGSEGWTRQENSPSVDRINSELGYVKGNVHLISWRANRIKNDSTIEELQLIVNYLTNLTK